MFMAICGVRHFREAKNPSILCAKVCLVAARHAQIDLDPGFVANLQVIIYVVVRRELRSYGYLYSLLNRGLRSYQEFPNHMLVM